MLRSANAFKKSIINFSCIARFSSKVLPSFIKGEFIHSPVLPNFINGEFVQSKATKVYDIRDPSTGELINQTPETPKTEFDAAVAAAKKAYIKWRDTPQLTRQRYMFDLLEAIKERQYDIEKCISYEHGKNIPDSKGDIIRGIEVVEQSCNLAVTMMGDTIENVSRGIDMHYHRYPLGVCAGITPYNFPFMCPLWMFPISIVCGNTFVLKPSERVANSSMMLAQILKDIKLPKGVFNMVHGGKDTVNNICNHPDIKAISFVGSTPVGEHIWKTGTANGKRVQANLGAKNHAVLLPDADKEEALNALIGAVYGSSGQRCMAISVIVCVGETKDWIKDFVDKAKNLKIGNYSQDKVDLGPLTNKSTLDRIHSILAKVEEEGGRFILDGRNIKVEGYPNGNWLGPTIIEVDPSSAAYKEELFGPVVCVMKVDTLNDALDLINRNENGNGTAVFTKSGSNARKFQKEVQAGQIGINIPLPVPLPMMSFTGNKNSFRGDLNMYGKGGILFNTQVKTVISRWKNEEEW